MIQVIGGPKDKFQHRSYRTVADRNRAIAMLRKLGFNYFVTYLEGCPEAVEKEQRECIQFSIASWVPKGSVNIQ